MGNMCSLRKASAVVLLGAVLAGCASVVPPACPAGLKNMTQAELFFGRDIAGGGRVGDEDWQHFVAQEITPRFPDGFTVQDGAGQWKGAQGIVQETSKRVTVVLSGAPDEQSRLMAVRESYKRRFHQDSVLVTEERVCAGF